MHTAQETWVQNRRPRAACPCRMPSVLGSLTGSQDISALQIRATNYIRRLTFLNIELCSACLCSIVCLHLLLGATNLQALIPLSKASREKVTVRKPSPAPEEPIRRSLRAASNRRGRQQTQMRAGMACGGLIPKRIRTTLAIAKPSQTNEQSAERWIKKSWPRTHHYILGVLRVSLDLDLGLAARTFHNKGPYLQGGQGRNYEILRRGLQVSAIMG